jgi:general L-amino acid transport system permease protein
MIKHKTQFLVQVIILVLLALLFMYFYSNAKHHLVHDHIASGFGFLNQDAGFDVIQHLISFDPESNYLRAFFVGVLNTLLLSLLAIIGATILGMLIALARLSNNWLIAKLGAIYVEFFRNIPLLLQVFFWYFTLLRYLPQIEDSWHFLGITINIRGFFIGPFVIIPELTAMLFALSLYSAGYISENIRSGIKSVDRGQVEAAIACGLSTSLSLRLIIMPQASKVIIPPMINQYLNILKNSSLGSAIGYPDLVAVFAGTVLNQTGQAIETIFMTMSFYLCISILTSFLMNLYNRKMVLKGK